MRLAIVTSGSKDPSAVAAELQCLSESYEQEGCLPFAQWIISRSAATELQDMVADARFLVIAGRWLRTDRSLSVLTEPSVVGWGCLGVAACSKGAAEITRITAKTT